MLDLSDENLAMSLQMGCSKPSYVGHPPSVNELRAYLRLESSRSLRTMKGGDATHARGPSYTMGSSYGKENYPSRGQAPPHQIINSRATCKATSVHQQCNSGTVKVLGTQWTGTWRMLRIFATDVDQMPSWRERLESAQPNARARRQYWHCGGH